MFVCNRQLAVTLVRECVGAYMRVYRTSKAYKRATVLATIT